MRFKLRIESMEGEMAVLKTENGLRIKWPKKGLPKNSKNGDNVYFSISLSENENKAISAKDILNEILRIN